MGHIIKLLAASLAISGVTADDFNVLQHLGGNGQWFPGMIMCIKGLFFPRILTSRRSRGNRHLI